LGSSSLRTDRTASNKVVRPIAGSCSKSLVTHPVCAP
jgi:hypothetical protein